MELIILKYGNLMGSPDVKNKLHEAGADTPAADALFDDLFDIKLRLGLDGRSTSVLLLAPECPELFPAAVDLSFLSADPASHNESSLAAALDSLDRRGLKPGDIKSLLVTHPHGDHHDPRLPGRLPNAKAYSHPGAKIPGAAPLPLELCPPSLLSLDTPGHGGPHCSYIADIAELNLSVLIAGDLIMSHAHFLALDHPLSFADHAAGHKSVAAALAALAARPTRYKMILPGHDIPFFV